MRASISSNRSSGRGRLPPWVVRIRSVLRCIFLLPAESVRDYGIVEPGAAIDAAVRLPHAPYSATQACTTIVCSRYSLPIGRAHRRRKTKESPMRKLLQGAAWAAWALALCVTAAHAQADYPSRPIKMYVPFPPGGG